jgi:hypothetical protein
VVVLLAPHEYFYKSQSGDSEIINIVMNDSGPAYAFRDGQYYELKWNRAHKDAMLVLTLPDGTPFPLKPGNTWFEVVGQSSNPQKPADGAWRFELTIP